MASSSDVGGSADYETLISTSDVELLKRAWRNEKAAPEILQYEEALVQRAKEQIELVIEKFMFHNLKSEEAERRLSEQEKVFTTRGESPESVEMERGDLYFIRYKVVKEALESGQLDLI